MTQKEDQVTYYFSKEITLSYFDPSAETHVQPIMLMSQATYGLSAVLLQNYRPIIAFASKSLKDFERRYANAERHIMLTVVLGCDRFATYIMSMGSTSPSSRITHRWKWFN